MVDLLGYLQCIFWAFCWYQKCWLNILWGILWVSHTIRSEVVIKMVLPLTCLSLAFYSQRICSSTAFLSLFIQRYWHYYFLLNILNSEDESTLRLEWTQRSLGSGFTQEETESNSLHSMSAPSSDDLERGLRNGLDLRIHNNRAVAASQKLTREKYND